MGYFGRAESDHIDEIIDVEDRVFLAYLRGEQGSSVHVSSWRKYLSVARRIARSYSAATNGMLDEDDLVQEGMLALVAAAVRFDESRKIPFTGYACNAVKYGIVNALRASDYLSQRDRATVKRMQKAEDLLYQAGVWEPSIGEVALACGIPEDRARAVRNAESRGVGSVPYTEDLPFTDRTVAGIDEWVTESLSYDALRVAFRRISKRDRNILWLRDASGMPVKDIAVMYGVSEGRVSQIVSKARKDVLAALNASPVDGAVK